MKSFKKNNKGFTLIELLAVIVILGVLMIIAIPMVSRYIREARQNAFVDTAKAYVQSARYAYLNGDYIYKDPACTGNTCSCPVLDSNSATANAAYIKFKYIDVDKSGGQSSFNRKIKEDESYVKIEAAADGRYIYSVYMIDEGGNSFEEKKEEELTREDVKTGKTGSYVATQGCSDVAS